jgi:hypothetical protein
MPPLSDPNDYILDLTSIPAPPEAPSPPLETRNPKLETRPYLSIHFKCCHVYAPIYKTADNTAYAGHCPRCRRPTSIQISPTGSTCRIFQAE